MGAVHHFVADCAAVLGHGGRLRNSLAKGQLRQSSPTPREAGGNPPQPARLAAPDVALPATGSALFASLVVGQEEMGGVEALFRNKRSDQNEAGLIAGAQSTRSCSHPDP
jgi:hypothetical protein